MPRLTPAQTKLRAAVQSTAPSARLLLLPVAVCLFTAILSPLLDQLGDAATYADVQAGRIDNKIFWPLVSVVPLLLVLRDPKRIFNADLPYALVALFLYLAFAGLSVLWAFKPGISLTRYIQQVMLVSAIVIPALLTSRSSDLMRRIYICFAIGAVLNLFFVLAGSQTISMNIPIGYNGYFSHKNVMGEFAAFACFFALNEISNKGKRRYIGIAVLAISVFILLKSHSKTSIALAATLPIFAFMLTLSGRLLSKSPATVLFALVGTAVFACAALSITPYDISEKLFGDRTFTGRTEIWDFATLEINRRPLGGWGFQSFWLVGLDGPSITDGPGWIKSMPTAHNGYLDVQLSTGRIGLALIIPFIVLTLAAIGRLCDTDPARGRLLFAVALFIILSNFLESTWLEGHAFQWPLFLLVSVEAARLTRASAKRSAVVGLKRAPARQKTRLSPKTESMLAHRRA